MSATLQIVDWPGPSPEPVGPADPSHAVYRQLLDAVLEQRLAPGTKLGEEQLGEIFAVSRPMVRRALARLAFERVVRTVPNRGAFVASPTLSEAAQVFEARRLIEEGIVRACVRSPDARALDRLRRHCDTESEAVRRGERTLWIRLSGEFHLLLAELAGNQVLLGFLRDLVAQSSLIIALYGKQEAELCCKGDHWRIVVAIAEGNEKKAVAEAIRHLKECEESLVIPRESRTQDLASLLGGAAPRGGERRRKAR